MLLSLGLSMSKKAHPYILQSNQVKLQVMTLALLPMITSFTAQQPQCIVFMQYK